MDDATHNPIPEPHDWERVGQSGSARTYRIALAFGIVLGIALEGIGALLLAFLALSSSTAPTPLVPLCWASAGVVGAMYLRHTGIVLAACLRGTPSGTSDSP